MARQSNRRYRAGLVKPTDSLPPKYLHSCTVSSVTAARYSLAATEFKVWARRNHRNIRKHHALDVALEDYCDFLFFDGWNIAHLQLVVYGVAHEQRLPTRSPV